MFLDPPGEDADVRLLFAADQHQLGFVMNLTRLWAWKPGALVAFSAFRSAILRNSSLTLREQAILVCATASELGDSYCALAWGKRLADKSDARVAAATLRGLHDRDLDPRESALLDWARKVVRDPNGTTAADIATLRAAGLGERDIFEATAFVALRLAFSTINDALGATPDPEVAEAAPAEVRDAVHFGRAVVSSSRSRDPEPSPA